VELDPQRVGDLRILPGPQFQITKHQILAILAEGAKNICACFEFEVLKLELDLQRVEDLRIPLGPRFQITKHLNIADLVQGGKLLVDVLNSRFGRWNWTPNTWRTLDFD
jgi:hypothetical protein